MDSPQPETLETTRETHLRDYWKVVWQGRYTVCAIFLLVVTLTAVYTFLQHPIYQATAIVEVQPQATRLAPGQDVAGLGVAGYGWWAEEKYHNTQVEIIKSRDVARRAADAIGLFAHPMFAQADDPVDAFRRMIQVVPRRETGLIEISISGTDAAEVTQWVNAVANAYVTRNLERAQENIQLAVESIRERTSWLEDELSEKEQDRLRVLEETEIFDPEGQAEMIRTKLNDLNLALDERRREVTRLGNILKKIDELQRQDSHPMTLPELAQDAVLTDLNRQKVELERQLQISMVTLKPDHPSYKEKLRQLETVQRKIDDQVDRVLIKLENDYSLAQSDVAALSRQVSDTEDVALAMGKATSRYEIASTDTEMKKRVYDLITETLNQVQLAAGLISNNVALLDAALVPRFPVKPNKRVNLSVGAMFGLFLGIGVVFFLDYLDNTFRTPQDIENYLGLSVLGVIPKSEEKLEASRALKEAYQSLRTSVIFSSKNRSRKVVLVTSTGPQEGKSSAAASLGRVLAGAGDRVIVVDCDLRRPTQHVHLKLARDEGLTNFLAGPAAETDWRPYVKATEWTNLQAIVCGPIPPSPPELLGSERFKRMLTEMREAYDWVLVDSPPAASLADSALLAAVADMVVLVVRHNQTDRDMVQRTVQRFRALNATLAGAVLNNVDVARAYHKDYYYAGYYYYSETADGQRKKSRSRRPDVSARAG